jgi:signal transduction histidine kinase/ActR/RegA family two-component response regulator
MTSERQINAARFMNSFRSMPNTTRRLVVMFVAPAALFALLAAAAASMVIGIGLRHEAEQSVRSTAAALGPVVTAGAYALDAPYLQSIANSIVDTPNISSVAIAVSGLPVLRSSRGASNNTGWSDPYSLTMDIQAPHGAGTPEILGTLTITTTYEEVDALVVWITGAEVIFIAILSIAVITLSLLALKDLALNPVSAFVAFVGKAGRGFVTTSQGETEINALLRFAREQVITLMASEERSRLLIESSGGGVFDTDYTTQRTTWNSRLVEMLGLEPSFTPAFAVNLDAFLGDPDREKWQQTVQAAGDSATWLSGMIKSGQYSVELNFRRRDGGTMTGLVHGVLIMGMNGNLVRSIGSVTDLTERRRRESQLQDERERLELAIRTLEQRDQWLATVVEALDSSQDRIAIQDKNQRVIYANRALRDVAAGAYAKGVMGASLVDLFPHVEGGSKIYEAIGHAIRASGSWRGELAFTRISGDRVVYEARLARTRDNGVLVAATDISAQKEHERREGVLQIQLAQAQKMEALGRLAGGIAHDFNNILGATRSFAELLSEAVPVGTRQHGYTTRIIAACDRAADLVRQILTFTRAKDASREQLRVGGLLAEVASLLQGRLPDGVMLSVKASPTDSVVIANEGQLAQVVLNVAVNAADAMAAGGAGEVSISSMDIILSADEPSPFAEGITTDDDGFLLATGQLQPGVPYVRVSVTDTGMGIPQSLAPNIFEPFFTTKDKRRGSGLGLAVVNSIVAAHGGVIAVQSRLEVGTAFHIYLPTYVAGDGEILFAPQRGERALSKANLRGKERILIVDDEVDMADAFSYSLTNLGYETAPVYSPLEAIEIFKEDPLAWDLVITDQSMPDMKGLDLIRKLKAIRPGIKTILCTGFSDGSSHDGALAGGADSFFTKPVLTDALAGSMRRLLDAAASGN